MSFCGNRSPITGECMLGCPGFGGCKRGTETPAPPHYRIDPFADARLGLSLFQMRPEDWLVRR